MKKRETKLLAAGALVLGAVIQLQTPPAWAASKKISTISLEIEADIVPGTDYGQEDIQIEASGSKFTVEGYRILNQDNAWETDTIPELEITLSAEDDYYFTSVKKENMKLKGSGVQYVSSSREDSNETMLLRVKLECLDRTLKDIEYVNLDDQGMASWENIETAGSYEIRVYREDRPVGTAMTSTVNSCNCREKMTRAGVYYVKVRAVNRKDPTVVGAWTESSTLYVDSQMAEAFKANPGEQPDGSITSGSWKQLEDGRWQYDEGNGSLAASGWKKIDGKWYYFDGQAMMQTGWIFWNGQYYYCAEDGHMLTDCITPDNYWVGSDGAWIQQEPTPES